MANAANMIPATAPIPAFAETIDAISVAEARLNKAA